ncbi:hypothetical protein [Coleofasciculus chthonoplastes]|uniref:hypothetical protein n=1 Tax=Coleofasciculus chthonoplastes TaxID=64178 RepID=UPI0032F6C1C0
MADLSINLGDIFLVDTGGQKNHWYIAIAPLSSNDFLFVNISTWHEGSSDNDGTCILKPAARMPGFINRKSFLAYKFARSYTADQLEKLIVPNSDLPYDTLEPQILRRVQRESLNARNLKKKYLNALRAYLGVS